ncbi:MAG: TonB-dependent receptor [Bacteroidales bacterium]|nr:TonB-dependent receptor [Bacteroidales bacterium]
MKSFYSLSISFILILSLQVSAFGQDRGVLEGRIYNSKNNQPLEFATIAIYGTSIGSISDLDGKFLFTGLKPGYVEIRASSVGYEPYVSEPILVTNANKVFIDIPMKESNIALDEITVKASPFRKNEESPVSLRRIDLVEIEKNPGGNRDISKVIQSYPGVASTPSFRNDIIVRGGGAAENRFYLDGVEIPNINHFATQGASGGPVGIINVDFIREVDFYSGAFPADRGNALSSVLELKQVDGNKDKLKVKGSVGASDIALTLDGPLGKNTSYIMSARRSYLQFLFSLIGLPFLPTYNDFQFKTKTRIDEKNEITVIGLGAIDQFALNLKANETEEQRFILGYLPVNEQWSYTVGMVYKHYKENGYDTWTVSRNHLNNTSYKYRNNDENDSLTLNYHSNEIENKLRYEHNSRLGSGLSINYGANLEYAYYDNYTFNKTYINGSPVTIDFSSTLDMYKYGIFAQTSKKVLKDRLSLSLGVRADGNSYSSEMLNPLKQLSPRFSASYMLAQKFFLNFNLGRYYQVPPYTMLGYRNTAGDLVNKENGISYISSDHIVGGIEWQPTDQSRLTVEGFYKYYQNYPYSVNDSISLASKGADFGTFGNEAVKSIADGRAFGMEILYRNKDFLGGNLVASYTLVRSESQAFRSEILALGKWVPTVWDNRHIINITGIKEFKKNWRLGLKWRFVGGVPYTPYDKLGSSYKLAWDVNGQGILDYSRFNQQRLSAFHQLDLRLDKEWFFNRFSLNLYLDVQNVYNFKADQQKVLLLDGNSVINPGDPLPQQRYALKEISTTGGTVLPTVGIIFQF